MKSLTCFSGFKMLLLLLAFVVDSSLVPLVLCFSAFAAARFSISNLINFSNCANEFHSSKPFDLLLIGFRRLGRWRLPFATEILSCDCDALPAVSITAAQLSCPFTTWSLSNTSEISFWK